MSKNFSLRPYQSEALTIIDGALEKEPVVLLQAVTGAGKTVMLARLINRYWYETKRNFLVLMHKQELVDQFIKTFERITEISFTGIGVCSASFRRRETEKRLTIATVQTFVNYVEEYGGCDLLIIDEAHRVELGNTQYGKTISALKDKRPNMRILGVTATPARLGHGYIYGDNCKPGAVNLFPQLNHQIKYEALKNLGYLVPLRGKVAHDGSLERDLTTVELNGDYVLDQLGEIMSKEIHIGTAVEAIRDYCSGYRRICVFCCTIDHANKLQASIEEKLEPCAIVHSQLTPLDRAANLEAWKSGKKRVITSVNILAEGFDYPALDCLAMARPTMSSSLYLQALGRALRPHEGKDHAFILDLTDNTARFGTDIDRMKVSVPKAVEKKIEKDKEKFKICPNCEKEVLLVLKQCPFCDFEWPVEEYLEALRIPNLKEVTFEKQPPVTVDVSDFVATVHLKKGSEKALGKVIFYYDYSSVNMFFCFADFYDGYALRAGEDKWRKISDDPYPSSIQEFESIKDSIICPKQLILDVSGKFPEILDMIFDEWDGKEYKWKIQDVADDEIPF